MKNKKLFSNKKGLCSSINLYKTTFNHAFGLNCYEGKIFEYNKTIVFKNKKGEI